MSFPSFASGEVLTAADMNAVGLWLVKSQTIGTGVSSVTVTNAFSSDYDNYVIKINRVNFNIGSTQDGRLRLGSTSGTYSTQLIYGSFAGTPLAAGVTSQATFFWVGVGGPSAETDVNFELMNPNRAKPTYLTNCQYINATNGGSSWGIESSSTSHTDFTYFAATGTMTGGTISVYGYKK